MEKYYPKASRLFNAFIEELANTTVYKLLKQAQEAGNIKSEVDLELAIKIYFFRIDNLLFKNSNLFESYGQVTLFNHLIIYNLKGLVSKNYCNAYFE